MSPHPQDRWWGLAFHLVALLLLAHLGLGVFRHVMDYDEFQFLHGGWRVAQGELPYRDFWDDHGPLPHLLCSLFYRAGGRGDAAALFLHRGGVYLLLLATAALLYALARRLRPGDGLFAGLALALFAASPILAHKGIEVRSDNLLQPLWVLALLLFVRAGERGSPRAFLASGAVLGAGFLITPKTLLLGVASGGMFLVWMAASRRIALREVAGFGLGAALPAALLALWQWQAGALAAFAHSYFVDSVSAVRLPRAQALQSIRLEAPLWALLGAAASAVVLLRAAQRRLPVFVACLFVAGAALVFQYVYVLPIRFLHSLIPAVVPLALVTAWAAREVLIGDAPSRSAWPGTLRRAVLVCAVLGVALFEASARRYDGRLLGQQLEAAGRIAAIVPSGAVLFDGGSLPVPYPRPLPDASLVIRVQQRIFAGRYPVELAAELDRRDAAWWRVDGRVRRLDPLLKAFREQHYRPLAGELWAAGRLIAPGPGGAADFEVRIAGAYWWAGAGPDSLRIDGRPAANPVLLGDGRHRAEWGGPGFLRLSVAPPEHWPEPERRELGGRATPLPGR
jgi:hypothetical protein